jgi:DNA-binding beta-propeller fold protein YncE
MKVVVRSTPLVLLVALSACGSTPSGSLSSASIEATPSIAAQATHVPLGPGTPGPIPSDSLKVSLGGETNGVVACAGWVWVAHGAAEGIAQIDPGTGTVIGEIEGGTNLACSDGEPWAAVGGAEIRHVDAETRETLGSVAVANAYYVWVGAGSIWAGSGHDVVRIDPATAEIVATISVALDDVTEVEGSDDAIWVTVKVVNRVYRIDPKTNTVVAKIPAGAFAHGILVGANAVWISNAHEETVTRIDPETNTAVFVDGPGSGVGLAEAGGYVWASSRAQGDLFRIDPATSQATPVVRIGGWPYGIAATEDMLWVSDGIVSVYRMPITELLRQ